jgi:hypothetical protein
MKKLFLFVLISIFLATGISYAGPTVFRNGANVLADPVTMIAILMKSFVSLSRKKILLLYQKDKFVPSLAVLAQK